MTPKPDQPPATEVAGIPAADPVDKASAVESEQDPAPDDVVGDSDTAGGAGAPETDGAPAAEQPVEGGGVGNDAATADREAAAEAAPGTEPPPAAEPERDVLESAAEPEVTEVPDEVAVVDDEPVGKDAAEATAVSEPAPAAGATSEAAEPEGAAEATEATSADSADAVPTTAEPTPEVAPAESEPAAAPEAEAREAEALEADASGAEASAPQESAAQESAAEESVGTTPIGDTDVAEPVEATPVEPAQAEPTPEPAPEPAPESAQQVEHGTELPRRPKRYEAPTEEISVVPTPTRAKPAVPAPSAAAPSVAAPNAAAPNAAPGAAAPAETATAGEPEEPTSDVAESPDSADGDTKPTPPKTAGASEAETRTPAASTTASAVDETFDFKALSFAAISAAHKRALGPRTVAGEADESQKTDGTTDADNAVAPEDTAEVTPAEVSAKGAPTEVAAAEADADLFAPPATRTPPVSTPPSPFPTATAPAQHQPGAAAQAQPSIPLAPPSPFPTPRGGTAHSFPAVHGYAPEASYAGWRPPTAADETAKRRRFALIGGAALAVIAVVAVIALVVSLVSKQQWDPIEAMIAEPQEVHPLQLVLGSCVESIPADGEVSEVLAVPCDASHTAQVVGRTDFADAAVWPGRDAVDKRVAQVCGTKQLGPTARTSPVASSVSYVVWGPSEESWGDGDRVGLCLATTAEPITEDLLQ